MAHLLGIKPRPAPQLPYLRATATLKQLIVDGEPFLMLAGELQNSSASSPEYMSKIWPALKAAHLNTVLANVAWENIEPTEGCFDFTVLDQLLLQARSHEMRLVLLWFGSFKNGLSTYAPPWAKLDTVRFPRVKIRSSDGTLQVADNFSLFGPEMRQVETKAFAALMTHLQKVDKASATVLMVQVENEVGILGDSRDRSQLAEEAIQHPVPHDLIAFLRSDWSKMNRSFRQKFASVRSDVVVSSDSRLSWKDLHIDTDYADELFMAYHYARHVDALAAVAKRIHPLPLFTNVWQNYGDDDADPNVPLAAGGGNRPGDYPSGGAVPDVLDVWQTFAPSLDFIAPDIYLNDYVRTCEKYRHRDQPLFIPEQRRDAYGARRIWTAIGTHQCLGTAPFGIDTVPLDQNPFTKHYKLLESVRTIVLRAQARGDATIGFYFDDISQDGSDNSTPIKMTFGDWNLVIERSFVFGRLSEGSGMIIQIQPDEFLLIGWGFQVTFASTDTSSTFAGLLRFEEREVVDFKSGKMRTLRWLNGDETRSGRQAVMPSEDPDYGGFPISITVPAGTGIAMCQPYALKDA
ncbi:hypothetical protein ANO11243_095770 [Dothideomycetidae sp. 11243]|nr:hypothetical protein ANO11243_095770 [fungal sp. No.11243]